MKKILLAAFVALASVSCLQNAKYYSTENYDLSFDDFSAADAFSDESVEYVPRSFYYGPFSFLCKTDSSDVPAVTGGVVLARMRDSTVFTRETPLPHFTAFGDPVEILYYDSANRYVVCYDNPDSLQNPIASISFAYAYYGKAVLKTVAVCNTVEMVAAVQGLAGYEGLAVDEWVKCRIVGYDIDSNPTGSLTFTLAERTSSGLSLISDWTTMDISSLGAIAYIKIAVISNNPNMPHYVCLDNLTASVTIGSEE